MVLVGGSSAGKSTLASAFQDLMFKDTGMLYHAYGVDNMLTIFLGLSFQYILRTLLSLLSHYLNAIYAISMVLSIRSLS